MITTTYKDKKILYDHEDIHTECVDITDYNDSTKPNYPKGLSVNDWVGYWMADGKNGTVIPWGGEGATLYIQLNPDDKPSTENAEAVRICVPIHDVIYTSEDGVSQLLMPAGSVCVGLKKYKDENKQSVVNTIPRRLAFADEIPKATCPFPVGFSFMLTAIYTDGTISDLKAAYPGTNWSYTQVAGLYNTNVIRRTK